VGLGRHDRHVIRNVVIHVSNEQPLLADLYGPPTASDLGLLCTNLRTMDGRRPVFIDDSQATFFFPYLHIRFLEIPVGASGLPAIGDGLGASREALPAQAEPDAEAGESDLDLEIDEDFLRKIRDL
jgi:hypothetical protein